MALRFTSLGSGSSGNALVVECDGTRVMMDCGFTISETKLRLERVGLAPSDLAFVASAKHRAQVKGEIAASPAEVFARLADQSSWPAWCAD